MTPEDFHIGMASWCSNKRWRCTDGGSRAIVTICLEPHEVVSVETNSSALRTRAAPRQVTDETDWLPGPPFAVAEQVFDEDVLEAVEYENFTGYR